MKSYRSRIGVILATIILISWVICIVSTYKMPIIGFLILNLLYIFITTGVMIMRYDIEGNTLHIRTFYCIFDQKVDIMAIKSIEHSGNIISSPAASTKRLLINYNKFDEVLISPVREEKFIETLRQINPEIEYIQKQS